MMTERDPLSPESSGDAPEPALTPQAVGGFFQNLWARILHLGLDNTVLRISTLVITVVVAALVVTIMSRFYVSTRGSSVYNLVAAAPVDQVIPTPVAIAPPLIAGVAVSPQDGIARQAALHTILPSRGRTELVSYVIQQGDNLFSIAEKFSLKPETILWGNRYTLGDDPHTILPGQTLTILPVDGTLHKWSAGEGLNGVADFYKVKPEDIIAYPANRLSLENIGDFTNPNIPPGTMLVIPGGKGEFPDWRTPRITRANPAVAKNVGPGACAGSYDGVLGTLNFTWPTIDHYLSGFDFEPDANHSAIDIAGSVGQPVTAADNGVVVYAGQNDWGYGLMVVIDHGQGWQSLYAHLASVDVGRGQEVYRGDQIGAIGTTGNSSGPHLHFELRSDEYGRVNPKDFLR